MKSTHKTTKTNTALCGLLSGLLLLAAGTAQTHAGLLVPAAPGAQLYVANISSNTIVKFTPGGVGSVFATTILPDSYGLAFDSAGNLYVSSPVYNSGNGGIEKFTTAGVGSSFASLQFPGSLAFDSAGDLYVDGGSPTTYINKITPGGLISTFATGFSNPQGMAFDSAGNLFVADYGVNTIFKYTPAGVQSTFITGLSNPTSGLAFDSAGNLYVSNGGNNTIGKITPGGALSTFATGLSNPAGLAFDSAGNLYVANYGNNTIQQFSSTGTDLGVFADSSDGLNGPLGLAFGPVPEPTSAALLLGSGAMLLLRRRRTAV